MTDLSLLVEDDLDWAFGELLHLASKASRLDIRPHRCDPELFYACMCVINRQPLEVRRFCRDEVLNLIFRMTGRAHPFTR